MRKTEIACFKAGVRVKNFLTNHHTGLSVIKTNVFVDKKHIPRFDVVPKKKSIAGDQVTTTGALNLLVFAKENGEPLTGAQYVIHGINRGNTTDEDAEGYEDLLQPGNYTGTLYMDGFNDLPFTFNIKAGETATVHLYMDKKII